MVGRLHHGGTEGTDNRDVWLSAAYDVLGTPRVISRVMMTPFHLADHRGAASRAENLARLHRARCWWHQLRPSNTGKSCSLEVWLFGEGR